MLDMILNGQAHGNIASQLMASNLDVGVLRPYIEDNGRSYVSVLEKNQKGKLVRNSKLLKNAAATLRKDEWIEIDRAIIEAAQPRLQAWADLRSSNSFTIPQGMGKTILESQSMSDITDAMISMDGNRLADTDRVHFDLVGVPLPIIHKDFKLSARQVLTSRNSGTPLDTSLIALAGRKVAESIEKLCIGRGPDYKFGGYSLYGYTNFPGRLTENLTEPDDTAWTPKTLVEEILNMRQQATDAGYYGPYRLYFSPKWSIYLDMDYSDAKGDNTLRERIARLDGIAGISTLDFLTNFDVVLVQMTGDVARAVVAMDITTVQWETMGGMEINLKIMAIMVPQLRTDFYGNTGLVHGVAVVSP